MKPPRTKLRTLLALGVTAAALAVSACGQTPGADQGPQKAAAPSPVSDSQLSKVTLKIGDQKGNSAKELLGAAGLLDDVPYKIEWANFSSGPPLLEAAAAGAVDVGQVGNTPPIFSAAGGGDINIVGALKSSVGDAVLVPKGSDITSLADLKGKRIGVAQHSSAHGTLLGVLNKAKLRPDDVSIERLQPADANAAFKQGRIDAWVVWEPYVSDAVENSGAQELIAGADSLRGGKLADGTALSNGLTFQVAGRSALGDAGKNTAIEDYVTRMAKADLWAQRHPDEWAKVYADQTGIALDVAKKAVPRIALSPVLLDDKAVEAEQTLADAFAESGDLPDKLDIAKYVDRRYNDAVEPLTKGSDAPN